MKTVIVLGAGASRAEASYNIRNRGGKRFLPPLDATLFKQADSLKNENYKKLKKFLKDEYHLSISNLNSFEYVFNLVHSKAIEEYNKRYQEQLTNLKEMFKTIIKNSTRYINYNNEKALYGLLTNEFDNDFTDLDIITFNYDLIAENVIDSIETNTGISIFSINRSYNISFDRISEGYSIDKRYFKEKDQHSTNLYKLHGSLNWLAGYEDESDYYKPDPMNPSELVLFSNKEMIVEYFKLTADNMRDVYYYPLIVPPTFEKHRYFSKILNPIWKKAANALKIAKRIIIFGYSLPNADIKAQSLFLNSLSKNRSLKDIIIIDNNPNICLHFMQKLNLKKFSYYSNVTEYLKEYK